MKLQLRFNRRALLRWALGVCTLALTGSAFAQQPYPSKAVRIIVPLARGRRTASRRRGCCWGGGGARPPGSRHGILRSLFAAGCAALALLAFPVAGQVYPSKAVRIIVPLAPGGPSDILARTLAQLVSPALGQPVVVENRVGAGGTIGADAVAKSPADGHTMLLMAVSTYTINASLYKRLPYDPRKDLTPVSVLATATYMLVAHPSLPVTSFKQLIALAKARPGDLNYASGGAGTGPQMAMELLKLNTGINITHVPYKGQGAALVDIIAGQVHISMLNMIGTLQFAQSGRLRALAVTGAARFRALPAVPTLEESGVPGFKEVAGHMIMVPGGTSPDVIARLNREFVKALQAPEVKGRLENEGAELIGNTPEQAAAIIRADIAKWADVIRKTGITAN